MESTPYVFSFRMVFFYLVTAGWIFDISLLCENSINQPINQSIIAINGIVQHTSGFLPNILLFTQAPILVWSDGTIIDISTIIFTMYHSVYVLL